MNYLLELILLLYFSNVFLRKYDYESVFYPSFPHMKHLGYVMDDVNKRGHQRIMMKLDQLPPEVTQIYFVLSSYKFPTISHFKTPDFKLIDETQPDKPLCTYRLEQAAMSQAVIMGCMSRVGQSMWQAIQIGKLSNGNIKNYVPIKQSIIQCSLFE
jgi:stress response protein SCP2